MKRCMLGVYLLGMVLAVCPLRAGGQDNDVLYLADTMRDPDGRSALYRVNIRNGAAELTLLPNGVLPYNHADVLCAEPNGSRLWFIDDHGGFADTGTLGWYDVGAATVHAIGPVTHGGARLTQINQAAIAPDGTLFITADSTDSLYTVDKATAAATLGGPIVTPDGRALNLPGSDIAFAADGALYIWINGSVNGPESGLYRLALPAGGAGAVRADYIGRPAETALPFTGLALRVNGLGDLVGAVNSGINADSLAVVDKTTGQLRAMYPLLLNGQRFDHTYGDMTIGPFAQAPGGFCTRTIGYWKNHTWNGRTITILGVVVDECFGRQILRNATSKNMSMLFAQLIAAKLNVNDASGLETIDGAEDYLALLDEATASMVISGSNGGLTLNWTRAHGSKTEKLLTTYWADLLDEFNNAYHCP